MVGRSEEGCERGMFTDEGVFRDHILQIQLTSRLMRKSVSQSSTTKQGDFES